MQMMAKYLGLKSNQESQIKTIWKASAQNIKAIRQNSNFTPAQKKKQIQIAMQATRQQVLAVLTPDQQAKWTKMMSRHRVADRLLMLRWIGKQLGLNSAQKQNIKPILQDAMQQAKAVRQDTSLTPASKKTKIEGIREAALTQIRGQLTPAQSAKLDQLLAKQKTHKGKW
jgi:hypothetical protein